MLHFASNCQNIIKIQRVRTIGFVFLSFCRNVRSIQRIVLIKFQANLAFFFTFPTRNYTAQYSNNNIDWPWLPHLFIITLSLISHSSLIWAFKKYGYWTSKYDANVCSMHSLMDIRLKSNAANLVETINFAQTCTEYTHKHGIAYANEEIRN